MKNIVLVGSAGHAKVIIDIVEKQNLYRICGLIDGLRPKGETVLGYAVLGCEADLPSLIEAHDLEGVIVAIGDNAVRARVACAIAAGVPQLPFVSAVHPGACIGMDVHIGAGAVVMAGAVVGPCSRVGYCCIVNTRASLDHDSVMEDFSSLAPGTTTGGNCRIGSHAAVGIGAILFHGVSIGEHSVVGGGALVAESVESFCVSYGVPAKKIRQRERGEKYL